MAALALIGGLLLAPVAASGCSEPINPVFEVVLGIQPVALASDMHVADLASMAARTHVPLRHPAYGFYIGTFGYMLKVTDRDRGFGSCPHNIKVHVLMGIAGRHIEIGQELRKNPCMYSLYLQHYEKHAASDAAVVANYRTRVDRALRRMKISIQESSASPEDQVYRLVRKTIDQTLQPLTPDRKAVSKEIDNPSEVEDLEHGCGRGSGADALKPM